jgi:ubiquitin carboxyl-terminal hydrolase 5/13
MDDPESDHEMTQENVGESQNPYSDDKPGIYELYGFITHLGASVKAGHYVCHLK